MERRLILAIALMIGIMVLANVVFPPLEAPPGSESLVEDTTGVNTAAEAASGDAPALTPQEPEVPLGDANTDGQDSATPEGDPPVELVETVATQAGEIVTVRSGLYEYRFDTRGARLVGATMLQYENFAPGTPEGEPVELVREGDALFTHRVAAGADTVSLMETVFTTSATDLDVTGGPAELRFQARVGNTALTYDVTYRFVPDDYRIEVSGGLRGYGDRGHSVLIGLGRGIALNEANEREDIVLIALVTRGRNGTIASERLDDLEVGEVNAVAGSPFSWAASKSKYWLAAMVTPEDSPGIGGVVMRGVAEADAAELQVTLPVPAGASGFEYLAYVGPQDFGRLQAVGQELHNVNPYGWRWLRWFIRPFGNVMMAVLIWMHQSFSMAYGWVLILFGVASRVILFPLYQISMRQQMKQMAVQPEVKKVQDRYKDDPQKLQQEMMKVYKEHGVSPLGGCLPMMLPFPILITLFFVFQNTIELRGVPFLWIPDLALKDPLFVIPALMGGSMLLLNWIAQRGMETNQQMKIFTYVFPFILTFMFAQFAAGLNLYYTASNIASLPQQMYLSRERRKAKQSPVEVKPAKKEPGKPAGGKKTKKKGPGGRS